MLHASVLDYIRSFATCRSVMAVTVFTLTLRTNATYQKIYPQFYPFSNRFEVRSCPQLKQRLQLGLYPNFFSVVTISGALEEWADTFESRGAKTYPPNTESGASDVLHKYLLYQIIQVVMLYRS